MLENTFVVVKPDGSKVPVDEYEGLTVEFHGSGSVIEIGEGSKFVKSRFVMGSNAHVSIAKTHRRGINNTVVTFVGDGEGRLLEIGAGTSIEGCRFAMSGGGPRVVRIGENCMFSSGIKFRPSDGHAIFDLETGKVINHSKPITLGDHVWVGADVTFVKGAVVPNNTVVGTGSLVSRSFEEEFTAVAGNPAKVVRSGIGWDRAHVEVYEAQNS